MKIDIYEQRIRDIFPELSIEKISLHTEGLNNDVVEVNNELIFRFPKQEYAVKKLNQEVKILRLIKNHINLDIPNIFYENHELIGYFMMCGVPLHKDVLSELDEQTLQLVAEQLATFLKELHSVPVEQIFNLPNSEVFSKYEDWVVLYERLQDEVFPQLLSHTRLEAKKHFESFLDNKSNFEYEPKLIHGALEAYHILFDKRKKCVSGIIDFGTAGLGDPAMDIAVLLYNYGESFLTKFEQIYPKLKLYLNRARFYAEAFELQQTLSGIKSQDITWFLSHLGSAESIKYNN